MRQKPVVYGTLTLLHKTFLAIGLYSMFYFKHLSGACGSNSTDIFPHHAIVPTPAVAHLIHLLLFQMNPLIGPMLDNKALFAMRQEWE